MLLTALIVILVLALALYGISLLPIDGRLSLVLQFVLVMIAVVYLLTEAGIL